MSLPDGRWGAFRDRMPVAKDWAYLDHAAVAPLPAPTRDVIFRWCRQAVEQGDVAWPGWASAVEQVRQDVAATIHAGSDEIAFVHNTTAGISLVAEGLPWQVGDNVVTPDNEFPSNVYPWMNLGDRGVETRRVPVDEGVVDVGRLLDHCDRRTRVISVSWVGFATGWRLDVAALTEAAHQRGILVFLDAIQGLGVFPLDVRQVPIDFLAADGHKWMLGPEGAGILYVRRDHLSGLRPWGVGWNSVARPYDFSRIQMDLRPAASRYEGGSQNMVGVLALGASWNLLRDSGLKSDHSEIADRVLAVTDLACQRLESIGARVVSHRDGPCRSGIVAFDLPGRDLDAVRRDCLEAGVVLSCRGGLLRISPHGYNNRDDIERLVAVLQDRRPEQLS